MSLFWKINYVYRFPVVFGKCIDRNYIYPKNIASVYKDANTRHILNLGCRFSWLPFLSSCRGHMFTYSVFSIFCAMDADVALLKVTTPWNYWFWYKQEEICIEIVKECSKIKKNIRYKDNIFAEKRYVIKCYINRCFKVSNRFVTNFFN